MLFPWRRRRLERRVIREAATHLAGGWMVCGIVQDNRVRLLQRVLRMGTEGLRWAGKGGGCSNGSRPVARQKPCLMRIYGQHKRPRRLSLCSLQHRGVHLSSALTRPSPAAAAAAVVVLVMFAVRASLYGVINELVSMLARYRLEHHMTALGSIKWR